MQRTPTIRPVRSVTTAHRQVEGGGFIVRRPFPTSSLAMVDPCLMLDEMGPAVYGPGEAVGAPDHPHRGFETVTYMLDGTFEHADSAGHRGAIRPGDVQWMTAGRGVIHAEMPSQAIRRQGGRVHGFQLWVNLPGKDKMMAPRYQEVPAARIPKAVSADGLAEVAVIAGEALGVQAVIETLIPIWYQDWTLHPGAALTIPLPPAFQACLYVFGGALQVGESGTQAGDGQLAVLGDGDAIAVSVPAAAKDAARFLLLAGKPIHEPVARYGPFVMNTVEQIEQAIADYQSGRMGEISR